MKSRLYFLVKPRLRISVGMIGPMVDDVPAFEVRLLASATRVKSIRILCPVVLPQAGSLPFLRVGGVNSF